MLSLLFGAYYPNRARSASSTLRTGWMLILYLLMSKFCTFDLGRMMSVNPSFSASAIRCSIRFIGRTSPLRPTSPAIHQPGSMAVSTLLDSTAAMTLRSMARSVTRSPPAIFTNTSFCISLNPTRFSSTASSMFSRRCSNPVAERCGVPYAADDTRACVSTRKGRTPSMAELMATPERPS